MKTDIDVDTKVKFNFFFQQKNAKYSIDFFFFFKTYDFVHLLALDRMSLKNFYVCGGAFESKCQILTYLLWTF